MVQNASIAAFAANIFICFALPLGCLLYLLVRRKKALAPMMVGAAVFAVFQLFSRIPLLSYVLPAMGWYTALTANPWLLGIFLGLTAGLFEEVGRFAGYNLLLKGRDRWVDGFAFGVGHGGLEAITLVGMTNINNLLLSLAINSGGWPEITSLLPAETAELVFSQLTSTAPFTILLGGIERISAFLIQIALSLLVLWAVRERRSIWLLTAICVHMVIDAPLVILPQVFGVNIYALELIYGGVAVASLCFIVYARRLFARTPRTAHPAAQNREEPRL